jgi:catechol 2,3-dioxygenase-like lactoylglutathione lyase family enzyme
MSQRYTYTTAAVHGTGWARKPTGEKPRSVPASLPVGAVRVARPTDRLDALRGFYGQALGLPELGSFDAHDGYSGVLFGLPGDGLLLEFTHHEDGSPSPSPRADDLLALYFDDAAAVDALRERLAARGYRAVEPENPYWTTVEDSVTVEDPDGWRVVLVKPRS